MRVLRLEGGGSQIVTVRYYIMADPGESEPWGVMRLTTDPGLFELERYIPTSNDWVAYVGGWDYVGGFEMGAREVTEAEVALVIFNGQLAPVTISGIEESNKLALRRRRTVGGGEPSEAPSPIPGCAEC